MMRRIRHASRQQGSFYPQLRQARLWLPATLVGVVLLWQLVIVPRGGEEWQFWSTLLFYSILGPTVTFVVLDWIATEVQLREAAQARMGSLYSELRDSHELLSGIQRVTESFAGSTEIEATLRAAVKGVTEVARAQGAWVSLNLAGVDISDSYGLSAGLQRAAAGQAPVHGTEKQVVGAEGKDWWVLSEPVGWAGRDIGVLQAWFDLAPDERQLEAFSIIAKEFSAAAEAAGARMRDLSSLVAVDRSMRAEGNLSRLLELLLISMSERSRAPAGGIYLADEGGLMHLAALNGVDRPVKAQPIRPGSKLVGSVIKNLEPLLINDLDEQPASRSESVLLKDARSVLVLPLQSDGMLLGLIMLTHPRPDHFTASGIPLLELMAGQVSWGVRNARAYLHSEELAIAEERARIAREIHDGVAQSLAFTALKLDLVDRLREKEPETAAAELATSRVTIRELIKEVRRSIFALRPVELERHGFIETIRRYTLDFGQQNDVSVEINIKEAGQLSLRAETILFRIFQEAMNNVAKHSRAGKVKVSVGATGNGFAFVEVEDDGNGFDIDQVKDRVSTVGGLGLRSMRERVQSLGGSLDITTAPGSGTVVRAELPS